MNKKWLSLLGLLLALTLVLTGCGEAAGNNDAGKGGSTTTTTLSDGQGNTTTTLGPQDDHDPNEQGGTTTTTKKITTTTKKNSGGNSGSGGNGGSGGNASSVGNVPAYSGNAYVTINNNKPNFTSAQKKTTKSYETYGALDSLGRCTTAIACVGKDLMPTEDRGEIGSVTPTGWKQAKYDVVDGTYLYNRSHLIGWQLTGEDANEKNLITGTYYMNHEGMLPFENMVADYIKETGNHVLYRATPIFEGNNLVASGVQIEAYSIEDDGDGICFNVYCYNVQPQIVIDYKDGSSYQKGVTTTKPATNGTYILNISSLKIHKEGCSSAKKMAEKNKEIFTGDYQDKIDEGYTLCGVCF